MKVSNTYKYYPNNVYSMIYPLYLASILFGIFPLATKYRSGMRNMLFSRFPIILTAVFTAIYFSLIFYILLTFKLTDSVLCEIRFYQDVFSALLYLCEIIVGCVFADKVVDIFRNIEKVDQMLQIMKIPIYYKNPFYKIIICMVLVFVALGTTLLLLAITDTFPVCYTCKLHSAVIEFLTCYLPFIANFLMELQYFQYLNILRLRYKQLNNYLLENATVNPTKIDSAHVATIMVQPFLTKEEKSSVTTSVNQVTKIHMMLSDTARLVNKVFCFQQLLKIAICLVSIITALFMFAMVFAVKDPSRLQVDIIFFIWTFSNALEMFIVVWISAETCKEANLCPIILHRIRNGTTDENLKSLIDIHSLQMYHSKLTFSVCGLFTLDYSLLSSMVAGTTTYLVILIQFNVDMVKAYNNQTL